MTTFDFFGYKWACAMEGGRLIHPDYPYVYYDETKISQVNNFVKLELGKPSQPSVQYWDGTVFYPQYGGGLLRSVDTFTYGTFSAEICMPKGKGLWPSFWLCGEGSWPSHGEIDICEGYSDNDYFRLFTHYFPWLNPSWKTTNNIHYAEFGINKQIGARSIPLCKQHYDPYNSIIKYECKWTRDEVVISINGKTVRKDIDAVRWFQHDQGDRMHVIFNVWCENPDTHEIAMETPMSIKNFKYKSL